MLMMMMHQHHAFQEIDIKMMKRKITIWKVFLIERLIAKNSRSFDVEKCFSPMDIISISRRYIICYSFSF